jgi:hypothetical protein
MMIRKPIELPPAIASGFVDAMTDYFAEENPIKRDAIAAHQLSVLGQYQNPRMASCAYRTSRRCSGRCEKSNRQRIFANPVKPARMDTKAGPARCGLVARRF